MKIPYDFNFFHPVLLVSANILQIFHIYTRYKR